MSRATGLSPASREAVPAPADPATLPPLTEIERETARAIVDAHSPSPVAEKATKVAPFDPGKDRIEKNPERQRVYTLAIATWAKCRNDLAAACAESDGGDIPAVPLDASAVNAFFATVWRTWQDRRLI